LPFVEPPLFAPPAQIPLSGARQPGAVAIADLNHDGQPDVVVANQQSNNLSVLLNQGAGRLQEAGPPVVAGQNPNDIAAGDFNRDGRVDLALANHDTNYLTVLLGDGRGGLAPAPGSPFPVASDPHPHGVAAGDFNRDGALDLVVESWNRDQVTVLFNDGQRGFRTPGVSFAVGDMPYHKLRAADVDGNGIPDVVTSNMRGGNVTVLRGDGRGGFTELSGSPFPVGPRPFGVALGDVNGDGRIDIATVHYSGSVNDPGDDGVSVLLAQREGGFVRAPGSPFSTGGAPVALALGDVNGDGSADIATANLATNNVTLLLGGRERMVAAPGTPLRAGKGPEAVALGDLDGDGKADLVVANAQGNDLTLFLTRPR
jgi:hypothetical protein